MSRILIFYIDTAGLVSKELTLLLYIKYSVKEDVKLADLLAFSMHGRWISLTSSNEDKFSDVMKMSVLLGLYTLLNFNIQDTNQN